MLSKAIPTLCGCWLMKDERWGNGWNPRRCQSITECVLVASALSLCSLVARSLPPWPPSAVVAAVPRASCRSLRLRARSVPAIRAASQLPSRSAESKTLFRRSDALAHSAATAAPPPTPACIQSQQACVADCFFSILILTFALRTQVFHSGSKLHQADLRRPQTTQLHT